MSSSALNRNDTGEAQAPPQHKRVTFRDTVEWASSSSQQKDDSPTKKYTFWMLLLGVLAMVIVIWIVIMFMSKSSEKNSGNGSSRSKSMRHNSTRKNPSGKRSYQGHRKTHRGVLDGMMSDSGSIQPEMWSDFGKKSSRPRTKSHRSSHKTGGVHQNNGSIQRNLVDPLPPNDISMV